MPFSQSAITSVSVTREDTDLLVHWVAASPGPFQVYEGRQLAWSGTETSCSIPWPHESNTPIEVGTVDPGEEEVDFSADLPPTQPDHATLSWLGGTYLDEDLEGFRVYMGGSPGAAVDYSRPVAEVTAYPQGIYTDGWGLGGWGEGGWGAAASRYTWRSDRLGNGTWHFGVRPFDAAENEGPAIETTLAISAPPRPPAADGFGIRLRYTFDPDTRVATLTWLPSPA